VSIDLPSTHVGVRPDGTLTVTDARRSLCELLHLGWSACGCELHGPRKTVNGRKHSHSSGVNIRAAGCSETSVAMSRTFQKTAILTFFLPSVSWCLSYLPSFLVSFLFCFLLQESCEGCCLSTTLSMTNSTLSSLRLILDLRSEEPAGGAGANGLSH
jgi:hypothetical protein